MKIEQIERGNELIKLIEVTDKAISSMEDLNGLDEHYWLNICQQKDGSGIRAELQRNEGNKDLKNVILNELKKQLNEFKDEFEKL